MQHSVSNDHNCSFVAATISIIVNSQSVSAAGHSVGVFHSVLMRSVACRVVVVLSHKTAVLFVGRSPTFLNHVFSAIFSGLQFFLTVAYS